MTSSPAPIAEPEALDLLAHGQISVEGRMAGASNATLYAAVSWQGVSAHCIYKPAAGERPLWDFPSGTLGKREVAAYEVSTATGWDVVPPTVWRDGPFGPGSVQLWVDAVDGEELIDVVEPHDVRPGWLTVLEAEGRRGEPLLLVHADDPRLARIAVFDTVIDNADRKVGHVLQTEDGHLWGVDHGVSFNVDDKLRTVLWGFAGSDLPAEATDVLRALRSELCSRSSVSLGAVLGGLLAAGEVRRTIDRVDRTLRSGAFPLPPVYGPAIPWPPW